MNRLNTPQPAPYTRRCPSCGKSVGVSPAEAGSEFACPTCGTTLPLGGGEILLGNNPNSGRGWLDKAAGWGLSVVVHGLILAVLAQVTWLLSTPASDAERPVGLVAEDESGTIGTGGVELAPLDVERAELAPLRPANDLAPMTPMEPVGLGSEPQPEGSMEVDIDLGLGSVAGVGSGEGSASAFEGLGGAGGGGGASFFGLRTRGRSIVYVIDRSGSMQGEKLDVAKEELVRSVRRLPRGAKFFIIFYNQGYVSMSAADLVTASAAHKDAFLKWSMGITGSGGTNPVPATTEALNFEPDVVYLLSDGLFPHRAAEAIRRANTGDAQIFTIAFYENSGEAVLKRIARENQGEYRFVPPPTFVRPGGSPTP